MPRDGKLLVGERLPDWQCKPGYVTEVVAIFTGRLPTPIDITSPRWGSSAESCALHGGAARDASRTAPPSTTKGNL